MKKPWYVLSSVLLLFALVLTACGAEDGGDGPGTAPGLITPNAATQAALATQGVQPLDPLATGAAATSVLTTPVLATPVPPTQAAATQAVATQVGAAPGVLATPVVTAGPGAAAPVVQLAADERPYLASTLLNMPVWNTLEGEVADVDGLAMDTATGNVHYALVRDSGGLHPIPFSMFNVIDVDPTDNNELPDLSDLALLLPISSSQLEAAPTIANDDLNTPVITGWAPGVQNYWAQYGGALPVTGQEPQGEVTSPLFVRTSGLFGGIEYDVENYQNEDLGDIDDFIINPDRTITYAIMQTSGFLNMGGERLLVPMEAMVYNPTTRRFLLPVDEEWLDQAVNQAAISNDIGPDFFWRQDWDAQAAAFWSTFQPIQPPPGQQITPGVTTPVVPVTPAAGAVLPAVPEGVLFSAARMSTVDIVGPNGDELGDVSNLAFAGDRLAYVVMRVAQGFAAVPFQAFQWDNANARLVYNQNINLLAGAPAIRNADIFDTDDYTWEAPIFNYWNERLPNRGRFTGFGSAPVLYYNRLTGVTLVDAAGVDLGSVADVMVDGQGEIRYLLINRNGRLIPVPWNLFTWNAQANSLAFTGDLARLDGAPGFNNLDDVDLFNPTWDDPVVDFWR